MVFALVENTTRSSNRVFMIGVRPARALSIARSDASTELTPQEKGCQKGVWELSLPEETHGVSWCLRTERAEKKTGA